MPTIEEAQEFIARELRERLQHLIGESYDPEKIKETVRVAIGSIYEHLGVFPKDSELTALSELLVVSFSGMPEDFDPKALLAQISDPTLERLASRIGECAFPANLLSIEWMKRVGNIVDWDFRQNGSQTADVVIVPKCPLKRIALDLVVDPEEMN